MDLTAVEHGLSIARVQYLAGVPRSGMVWSLSVVGADLVCPRVSTNHRRSRCHRARDGHDDLFCGKIKASRVLGPAARSEGHYARIRILIRDSISCVARPR